MKIVVISPRFPYPLEKGDKLRLYYHLRHLSEKFEIVLISLTESEVKKEHRDHIESFVSKVYLFRLSKAGIILRLLKGIFSQPPSRYYIFQSVPETVH
ncbi:MAG: hypothetical protein IPH57_05875 [Saprospiraceae bacterium]|nr:hypothetical protein [Saprospiraceae bacterium]